MSYAMDVVRPLLMFAATAIMSFSFAQFGVAAPVSVYISDPVTGVLSQIDSKEYTVISTITIGGAPIALWGVGDQIAIMDEGRSLLRIYNRRTSKLHDTLDIAVASLNGGLVWKSHWVLWASSSPYPSLVKWDSVLKKIVGAIRLPTGSRPGGMDIAPNGRLYVVDSHLKKIYIVDPESMTLLRELPVKDRYLNVKIAEDGKAYFTGATDDWEPGDWVDVWDTNLNGFVERLIDLLPKGATFVEQAEGLVSQQEMVVDAKSNLLIAIVYPPVATVNSKEEIPALVAIDLKTKRIVWRMTSNVRDDSPISLAVSSDEQLFVTGKREVKVIDMRDGKIKQSLPISNGWGITAFTY